MGEMNKQILGFLGAALVSVTTSWATSVDFTSSAWNSANGQATYQVGDVKATAYSTALGARPVLTASPIYGLGVDSRIPIVGDPNPDEVGFYEILAVDFFNSAGTDLTGASVTKLFPNELLTGNEKGMLKIYSGSLLLDTFNFTANNSSGNYFIDFGGEYDITGAKFYANVKLGSEFAVAGFTAATPSSVPDGGATMMLLGMSILGVASVRRSFVK
jgi:hypothetical protein